MPSSAQPSYVYIAQRRSAVRCGAMPHLALRCGAVSCCVVLSFEQTAVTGMKRSTRYRYVRVVYSYFCFFFSRSLSVPLFLPPRKLHQHCRSERDTANKHTAQHRAISSAQTALGITNSLFAPNRGPLLSAPFTCFSCIPPCASVAGGVSRPRGGALVYIPFVIILLLVMCKYQMLTYLLLVLSRISPGFTGG